MFAAIAVYTSVATAADTVAPVNTNRSNRARNRAAPAHANNSVRNSGTARPAAANDTEDREHQRGASGLESVTEAAAGRDFGLTHVRTPTELMGWRS
ncbi:hypothetical protein ACFQRB_19610 [Halobaculum litoreum]|uniref:Secreted protein n=1 Tax=Halobaculum litoreum TaxID=3031998 RepID=A0ABD5XSC0_9EURY